MSKKTIAKLGNDNITLRKDGRHLARIVRNGVVKESSDCEDSEKADELRKRR